MKRSLISILFAMLLLPSSFGYEWGLSLVNSTEFKGQEFDSLKLNQNDSLSLWTKIPFNKSNSSYLVGDVSYHFKYEDAGNNPVGFQNIVNLNMFKFVSELSFNNVNKMFIMAGRFPIVDSSRKVFAQSSDGLYLKYAGVFTNISLYGGYTGLLNSKEVTVLTPSETKYKEASNDFYTLAPKYVPVSVMFNFPSLFANQQLNIQGWGFLDLNGDNFNRYYANIELDGYLAKGLNYSLSSVFGTVNFENLMNCSELNIKYFISEPFALQGSVLYASGKNGMFDTFTGVTSNSVILAYENTECSNLFKAELGAVVSVLQKCLISAKGAYVADFTEESMDYRGIQWESNIIWNIFDDVQLSASMGQFYGQDSKDNQTRMSVNLNLAF
ncbi:MAG: hypothetical protein IIW49_07750 [Treponema sp.]|nr:hypothetical protein [Treponema sp.]